MAKKSSLATPIKCNAAMGDLPVLQYCAPEQLLIDETYQRSLDAANSITLIRRMAMYWDWGLCQPLFVARRADGALYVVDGQHRLAAAKLRGDIFQLPCVVRAFDNCAAEAAAFVALNQERRPLSKLQIFKAAIAAGDFEASQIILTVHDAGLHIASTSNLEVCKPGALSNIAGLQNCYRVHGVHVLGVTLRVLASAYPNQILRYAGTIFGGIVVLAAKHDEDAVVDLVASKSQDRWVSAILRLVAEDPSLNRRRAAAMVFEDAWSRRHGQPSPVPTPTFGQPTRPEAKPTLSFEQQLARVESGEVGIAPAFKASKPIDQTLGGIGTAAF